MAWSSVSSGAGGRSNEDAVLVFEHAGVTDIVVLDGASSVAQQQYVDQALGDVAWFVREFGAAFGKALLVPGTQEATVRHALEATAALFRARTGGQAVPLHAWPIAAMTWIRILPAGGASDLLLYCLGDCKTLLRRAGGRVEDLDPWVNPQEAVVQEALAALTLEGVLDPAARRARLLPMLRRRREEQNTARAPEALCLAPEGPFAARRHAVRAESGDLLLSMTDGFYRLVEPYGILTDESLLAACAEQGLAALLERLRGWEAAQGGFQGAVKAADDASAAAWRAD